MLTNNLIPKKLKVALKLDYKSIYTLAHMGGYQVSSSEARAVLLGEEHRNYRECSDRLLSAVLDGLIKYYRDEKS